MTTNFKAFTTTLIGSMPRSAELLAAKEACVQKENCDKYEDLVTQESQAVMDLFQRAGIDVPVSGEISRDNYMSYVAERVKGIKLYSTEEIKELTQDIEGYAQSLEEMDAADNSMNSPVCIDRLSTDDILNREEMAALKKMAYADFKITIPSPYLLTRSMWVDGVTDKVYADRAELGKDVVALLQNEIRFLVSEGAKVIQIDEPILTEVVFQKAGVDTSFY